MESPIELRWIKRTVIIGWETNGNGIGHKENILQFRVKEGPRGEDWWGEWKDVPFSEQEHFTYPDANEGS